MMMVRTNWTEVADLNTVRVGPGGGGLGLEGEVEGIMTSGGKKQWKWLLRCIGCRRTEEVSTDAHRSKKDDVKLCDRCGSPMKLKRA